MIMDKNIPRIHLHVMCIEEENSGRNQSDVEILDVNLNIIGIYVDKSHRGEFGNLTRRLGKDVVELETDGVGGASEAEDEDLVDGVSDDRVDFFLPTQSR